MKLADGFIHETDMKLWNRQIRSGKKIETDGTRLRRGRQFQFFSWPNLDGFIISVSFMYETTASFIFWAKKQKKLQHFSSVSRETDRKKKSEVYT